MTNTRHRTLALLTAALVGLASCGDANSDDANDTGVVTGDEFLGHQLREIPADDRPTLELDVEPDEHGGWNVRLDTDRFTFTPEQTNGPARPGEGHAHVYVDETKFSRAYAEWFFLPAAAVGHGEHTVLVTLNADDHTIWAADGEPITATATVTGMADDHSHEDDHPHEDGDSSDDGSADGDSSDDGSADGDSSDDASDTPADVELEFEIAAGKAEPPLGQQSVTQGDTVRIVVTSDEPDEVHLHGYDLDAAVSPDQPGVLEFVADQTGRFELETHETGLVLLQLLVE